MNGTEGNMCLFSVCKGQAWIIWLLLKFVVLFHVFYETQYLQVQSLLQDFQTCKEQLLFCAPSTFSETCHRTKGKRCVHPVRMLHHFNAFEFQWNKVSVTSRKSCFSFATPGWIENIFLCIQGSYKTGMLMEHRLKALWISEPGCTRLLFTVL